LLTSATWLYLITVWRLTFDECKEHTKLTNNVMSKCVTVNAETLSYSCAPRYDSFLAEVKRAVS